MSVRKKHFVTFYSPGTFFHEVTTKEIPERDPGLAIIMAETILERYDAKPFCFRFDSRMCADPVPDGMGGQIEVPPKLIPDSESGSHFICGKLFTLDEVIARNDPKEDILRLNMRSWPIVCETRNSFRSMQPFEERDCVVDATGKITERGDDPKHVAYRAKVASRKG